MNPSRRLLVTFFRGLEDAPAYDNFPRDTEKLQVNHSDGSLCWVTVLEAQDLVSHVFDLCLRQETGSRSR